MENNYFKTLNSINVNDKIEKKNGLSYLSWAYAWGEVKKLYPDATYTIYENEGMGGMPYFTDGRTCMVKTGVTINGIEHIEYLPVMDFRNASIPFDKVTSFDVNKAIQRSLTKAIGRHGLGLYIYAGEDLPEDAVAEQKPVPAVQARRAAKAKAVAVASVEYQPVADETYWKLIEGKAKNLTTKTGEDCFAWWLNKSHAPKSIQDKFVHDVENYRIANNI